MKPRPWGRTGAQRGTARVQVTANSGDDNHTTDPVPSMVPSAGIFYTHRNSNRVRRCMPQYRLQKTRDHTRDQHNTLWYSACRGTGASAVCVSCVYSLEVCAEGWNVCYRD